MRKSIYPVTIFILLQLLTYASITLWIVSYVVFKNRYETVLELVHATYSNIDPGDHGYAKMICGILILSFILIASTLIFVEWVKTRHLFKKGTDHLSAFTHEMMTPLTCINMNIEALILNKKIDKKVSEILLDSALKECSKLKRSINKIVEFKSIVHRKSFLNLEETNLYCFLLTYIQQARLAHSDVTINLKYHIDRNNSYLIDHKYIRCILDNLVENSINFSNQQTLIDISVTNIQKKIVIEFSDNGIGLQTAELKKIFKIFYRINMNRRGSGLGLYLIKNILKWHNGTIKAFSHGHNMGTTFTIAIKLKKMGSTNDSNGVKSERV